VTRRIRALIALLAVVAVLAAGCSSSDDSSSDDTADDTAGPGGLVSEGGQADEGEPVPGGTVEYGLGAETDGWNPTSNTWAPEGLQVARTVYDPLTALDIEGVAQPYLAESLTPNDDYTQWTIRLRPGVTFHNGDPLTAAAVKTTLDGHLASGLTRPVLAPVESVEAPDDLTVVVTMNMPWVAFPQALTGQTGVIPHPSIITDRINDDPIGTGPFAFVEWIPDQKFVADRYDNYWREGLPYLDRIEYRPITDEQSLKDTFDAEGIDIFTGGAPEDILEYRQMAEETGEVKFYADRGENEESFVMVNMTAPPFDDVRVRRALAYATDQELYNETIDAGQPRLATGPLVPENPFYVDVDYPTYDPEKATELLDEVEADKGEPVSFTLSNTTSDVDHDQSALFQQMWEQVGFEVELAFTEQTQYILDTLAGDYEAVAWRQFAEHDPDTDSVWWYSDSDLNFANLDDPEIDAALDQGRTSADPEVRKEAYATLQERFAELVPFIWINHVEWGTVAYPYVNGIPSGELPDGTEAKPFVAGTHFVTQMWLDPDAA
jgi:ABC-type transport system substrate-binding protein